MFTDEANIIAQGGHGGSGVVSWRREKYVAKGGPDGGDGGDGGNVYLVADPNTDTLSHFLSKKTYKAEPGGNGRKQKMHGKNGDDVYIKVPPGTLVYRYEDETDTKHVLADLSFTGDQVCIARGGRGGFGNWHFKSSVRQRPDFCELGEPGEEHHIYLELQLVADVGIIGLPSVGKSTLIRSISAAKPKVAAYEFTTLVPNLGVVQVDDRDYIVCDVPGLIEGASEGRGLGHRFLKHIERCGVLLHVLDVSRAMVNGTFDPDVLQLDYQTIRAELDAYSPTLAEKTELIILNKVDLLPEADISLPNLDVFARISAATNTGTRELTKQLLPIVLAERERRQQAREEGDADDIPVLTPHTNGEQMANYRLEETDDAVYVYGKRLEQLAVMTDFSSHGAVKRFRDICERIGLQKAVRKLAADKRLFVGQIDVTDVLL